MGPATDMLLEGFRSERLPVSKAKTNFLCSSQQLAEDLEEVRELDAEARKEAARNLGTDASYGRWRRVQVAAARGSGAEKRAARLRMLRAAGADTATVHRARPVASAVWGAAVAGLTDAQLHQLRVAAARSMGRLPKGLPRP